MGSRKIAVLGAGKMGQAFLKGFRTAALHEKFEICSSCRTDQSRKELEKTFSWPVYQKNDLAARGADILILGVKPWLVESVLKEVAREVSPDALVISLAAGITLGQIQKCLPKVKNLVRVMPNLPATLGKGVLVYSTSDQMDSELESRVEELLLLLGQTFKVPERLMDAAAALSGGAPAYLAYFVEAMTAAGVKLGFARGTAYEMVLKSFFGSAEMLYLAKDLDPEKLIAQVCTPGGTTIEGLGQLDEGAVKGSILRAVTAAAQKSAFLGGRKLFVAALPPLPRASAPKIKLPPPPKVTAPKKKPKKRST